MKDCLIQRYNEFLYVDDADEDSLFLLFQTMVDLRLFDHPKTRMSCYFKLCCFDERVFELIATGCNNIKSMHLTICGACDMKIKHENGLAKIVRDLSTLGCNLVVYLGTHVDIPTRSDILLYIAHHLVGLTFVTLHHFQ